MSAPLRSYPGTTRSSVSRRRPCTPSKNFCRAAATAPPTGDGRGRSAPAQLVRSSQAFGDLHRVQRRTLQELIPGYEQRDRAPARVAHIATDTPGQDRILP